MVSNNKKIIFVYGLGVLGLIIIRNTPISIPCLFKLLFNMPCPGCGLIRAFVLASQFDFVNAFKMNILSIVLMIGMSVYFICALVELVLKKPAIQHFNAILAKKWIVVPSVILMAASWYYNFVRNIP